MITLIQPPVPFEVKNAGEAVNALLIARRLGLQSAYLPRGGRAEKLGQPVYAGGVSEFIQEPPTHTVYVVGEETQIEQFKLELEKIK